MYLELEHLAWLFALAAGLVYWWHAYGIKQLALKQAQVYCDKMNLQMLDESIALGRVRWRRDTDGKLAMVRIFRFEFASTGDERYRGEIIMHGRRCQHIELEAHRIN